MTEVERPWLNFYSPGVEPDLGTPASTVMEMFRVSLESSPAAPAVHYFGRTISRAELDRLSVQIASVLRADGVGPGDRVAVSLQNTPVFPAVVLAVWLLGGSVVPINPMLRPDELTQMLADSGATTMLAHPEMYDVVMTARGRLNSALSCWWSDPAELAGEMAMPFASEWSLDEQARYLVATAEDVVELDLPLPLVTEEAYALITYTSGTTGPSKGAVSTHANLAFQAVNYMQWLGLRDDASILTVAPLFHITGLGAHLCLGLAGGFPLVMTYRFEPATMLSLIDRYRPTFAIGAITAFIAMLDGSPDSSRILSGLTTVYSGGAPVPAHVVERFQSATGRYIHNAYGLTETSSACIAVPFGREAPVDPGSGALSIGVPMGGTTIRIVDDHGVQVPPGEQGEIVVSGPQVDAGYWNKPEETANAFRADGVHTGDIGVMDDAGWVYVVDRKKDLVVVSGYKVWPRDVEDVLYQHPAIKEVAVVGKPHNYRGETLHAYYSLRPGAQVDPSDLRAWCKERLSAYKVPTDYSLVEDVPKTASGKILRRSLRD
jgi:long-chain acyl-CoA synthetase